MRVRPTPFSEVPLIDHQRLRENAILRSVRRGVRLQRTPPMDAEVIISTTHHRRTTRQRRPRSGRLAVRTPAIAGNRDIHSTGGIADPVQLVRPAINTQESPNPRRNGRPATMRHRSRHLLTNAVALDPAPLYSLQSHRRGVHPLKKSGAFEVGWAVIVPRTW